MSVSTTVKNQLIGFIETLSSVEKVYGYEMLKPEGFPAVFVVPGSMDGEFVSNSSNSRVYAFDITCIMPMNQDMPNNSGQVRELFAEETIATVLDEIINSVDTNFVLDGTPVLYVNAADIQWGTVNIENGVCKAAQISLRIYTEYSVR